MAVLYMFVVLVVFGNLIFVTRTQTTTTTVQEGEPATLPCNIGGSGLLTWSKTDSTTANRVVAWEPVELRYGYYGNLTGGRATMDANTGNLTIHSTSLTDESVYYCSRGFDNYQHSLVITVIPEKPLLEPMPSSDYVPVGTVLDSTCVLDRVKPAATILTWRLHGDTITEQDDIVTEDNGDGTKKQSRHLQLTLDKEHHNKDLSCMASIDGNVTLSDQVILKVGYAPSGTPVIRDSPTTVRLNDEVVLTCDTTRMTPGSTESHWYAWTDIGDGAVVQNTTSPSYRFNADEQEDAGNFTCIIGNPYGRSEESAIASVFIKGVAPKPQAGSVIPYVGGALGGLVLIIVVVVIVVCIRKRSQLKNAVPPYRMAKGPDGFTIGEDHVRPLGEGSPVINGIESSAVGRDEYVTVAEKQEPRTRPVPQPRPSKTKDSGTPRNTPEPTYAEPIKVPRKEEKKKNKKEKKRKESSPEPEYAEPNEARRQIKHQGPENPYMNTDNNNLTPQQQGRYRSAEGQLYTEVAFDHTPSPPPGRRPQVRRMDEPTEYARVDFTKTAPPPKDDDYDY